MNLTNLNLITMRITTMNSILDKIDPEDLDDSEKLNVIIAALIEAAEERAEILEKLNNISIAERDYEDESIVRYDS